MIFMCNNKYFGFKFHSLIKKFPSLLCVCMYVCKSSGLHIHAVHRSQWISFWELVLSLFCGKVFFVSAATGPVLG